MKIIIDKGKLQISIVDLLDSLGGQERIEIADALSCQDDVIRNVTDQIISGWTVLNSSAGRACSFSIEPWCALDIACRRIAEASSDIAKKEIDKGLREIESLREKIKASEVRYYKGLSRLEAFQIHIREEIERGGMDDVCAERLTQALAISHKSLEGE